MALAPAEFEAQVLRMEALAKSRPKVYRRRVFALAALGYLYLLVVVIALLALCGLAAYSMVYLHALGAKLVYIIGALLFVVVRALWVKFEPPEGERIARSEAPGLFALLDELRTRLRTPRVHVVVVNPEFNAAVMQLPRLGLFGLHRNFLLVGLPLMKGLSIEQFKAVLAHELGHLSRGHARASNWIYRMRRIWTQLEASFEAKTRRGAGAIRLFFKWYIPYFAATSFPLARANEYEADSASALLTSARSAAQALTSVHIMGSFLERKYWPAIYESTKLLREPTCSPYSSFVAAAVSGVSTGEVEQWQRMALARETSLADTHPALSDRLKAIGASAEFVPPAAGESAELLLGAALSRVEQAFDAQWRMRVAEPWKRAHENAQKNLARRGELVAESEQSPLDVDKALELAELELEVGQGAAAALEQRRTLQERFPDSLPVKFALARQLLTENQEEGVALMEGLVAQEKAAVQAGSELLRDYYWGRGEVERARHWHERFAERTALLSAMEAERKALTLDDECLPHELGAEALGSLVTQLRQIAELQCVYLVRKSVRHCPEEPQYVLAFKTTEPLGSADPARERAAQQAILDRVNFPGAALIFSLELSASTFERKLQKIAGSQIL